VTAADGLTAAPPFRLPPPAGGAVDVLVVAGEHSGDEHAARMVRGFLAARPGARVAALGGPLLAAAGAQLLFDLTASSVVGYAEVLKHLSFFRALQAEILRWIEEHAPRAVCLVDYPGMNLRLAAALRARGLSVQGGGPTRVLYYISPQIWAWKAGRRFEMARDLDALAVIFPFEVECYADTALPVEFVGHPFVMAGYVPPVAYDPAGPILLLPGSRRQAVARIFPALLEGYARFQAEEKDADAASAVGPVGTAVQGGAAGVTSAPALSARGPARGGVVLYPSAEVLEVLRSCSPPPEIALRPTGTPVAASAVLTSSGTMSMHCALAGIPGAIVYRTSPVTYLFARWLLRVRQIGIANLLLGAPMYPEFIQAAATPVALAAELSACVRDPGRRRRAQRWAARLRCLLGRPSGGEAADWITRQVPADSP
jgi:lipid-A-disaccharide synthase